MYFRVYQDDDTKWRWTLFASNDEVMAVSADGYGCVEDAGRGIGLVMSVDSTTPVVENQNDDDAGLIHQNSEVAHI